MASKFSNVLVWHTSKSLSTHLSGTTPAMSPISLLLTFVSPLATIKNIKLSNYKIIDKFIYSFLSKPVSDLPFSDPTSFLSLAADCKVVMALLKSPSDVSKIA